jgi:hypothetical protein
MKADCLSALDMSNYVTCSTQQGVGPQQEPTRGSQGYTPLHTRKYTVSSHCTVVSLHNGPAEAEPGECYIGECYIARDASQSKNLRIRAEHLIQMHVSIKTSSCANAVLSQYLSLQTSPNPAPSNCVKFLASPL